MKLLLVEDDRLTAEFIKLGLKGDGHDVAVARTGRDGLLYARTGTYDALILDLNLPDTTALAVTEILRRAGSTLPILILTAASLSTESIVHSLNAGADDY